MIETYIQAFLNECLDFFTNPQKRVYWVYILSAMVIALIYVSLKKGSFKEAFMKLFSYETWLSHSAKADYKILFLNQIFMMLISSRLLAKSAVSIGVFYLLIDVIPQQSLLQGVLENWQVAILFTFSLFIVDDFTKYWLHRWLHTIPFLWPFHRVHHSATQLNFFTVFRTHPVEAILFSLRNAVSQGLVVGIFFFLFSDQVNLVMVLGANIFSFLFNILGSNLRHSPVALPYPKWLERYFISPAQHHIHHSSAIEHKDKNFGIILSCWDRWFGSFYHSIDKEIKYGVFEHNETEHQLKQLYISPFVNSYKRLIK